MSVVSCLGVAGVVYIFLIWDPLLKCTWHQPPPPPPPSPLIGGHCGDHNSKTHCRATMKIKKVCLKFSLGLYIHGLLMVLSIGLLFLEMPKYFFKCRIKIDMDSQSSKVILSFYESRI